MSDHVFDSVSEEAVWQLFRKGFGTCRADSGEYTVIFRFKHLADAQKAYRDLCAAYMRVVENKEGTKP